MQIKSKPFTFQSESEYEIKIIRKHGQYQICVHLGCMYARTLVFLSMQETDKLWAKMYTTE